MLLKALTRIPANFAVIAVVLLTSGCGGGGGGGAGALSGIIGSGGTGFGVATGFGSLIVDGVRRDDTQASYTSEEDQGTAVTMPSTSAMLGQMVEFAYDPNGAMTSIIMSPELVGLVTSVGSNSITVLGTTVSVNSDTTLGPVTVFAGYASATAIQIGDRVAVYGLLKTDAQGNTFVQATLLVQKVAGTGIRLTGYVSQYNATSGNFTIGNNTINVGAAAISPAGTVLANGELVTVWSNTVPTGNVIAANSIRVKLSSTGNLTLSGPISGYTSNGTFKLLNVAVDANKSQISPAGTLLVDGKYVVVTGQYDAATGKLTATSVTAYAPPATTAVELHGTILNFVSASSFTVRGVTVDASSASFSGGVAKDLANGVFVEITGAVANNIVRAATVTVVALNPALAPVGSTLDLMGTVTSYNPATQLYTMSIASGISMSGMMGSSQFFINGTASNLVVGQSVIVRGMMNGGTLTTSVVSFTQSASSPGSNTTPGSGTTPGSMPGITYMEGVAYNVTATSFMLNGLTIQSNAVPVMGGGMMGGGGMMSGSRIGVNVQYSGGQYTATTITVLNG
ncbi:MAG: DUF5666 domain-containing protein [Sterolibacterium sp.]